MRINQIIEDVLANEGGYSHDARDAGGETMYGITIATARASGYTGQMKNLPRETAFAIYRKQYVEAPKFDKVAVFSEAIAAELVDTGVNMGPSVPSRFLQRALNGLNNQGKDYGDIVVDGVLGAASLGALSKFLAKRGKEGERRLLLLLNALQGSRYLDLAEGRGANEAFLYGWLGRLT